MKKIFKTFLRFESKNELGMRYYIFTLKHIIFQPKKFGTIQMCMLQSIGANGRVEYLQWWGINDDELYHKHMCIMYLYARLTT